MSADCIHSDHAGDGVVRQRDSTLRRHRCLSRTHHVRWVVTWLRLLSRTLSRASASCRRLATESTRWRPRAAVPQESTEHDAVLRPWQSHAVHGRRSAYSLRQYLAKYRVKDSMILAMTMTRVTNHGTMTCQWSSDHSNDSLSLSIYIAPMKELSLSDFSWSILVYLLIALVIRPIWSVHIM